MSSVACILSLDLVLGTVCREIINLGVYIYINIYIFKYGTLVTAISIKTLCRLLCMRAGRRRR